MLPPVGVVGGGMVCWGVGWVVSQSQHVWQVTPQLVRNTTLRLTPSLQHMYTHTLSILSKMYASAGLQSAHSNGHSQLQIEASCAPPTKCPNQSDMELPLAYLSNCRLLFELMLKAVAISMAMLNASLMARCCAIADSRARCMT